jgi:positive regulator of sigma E activity
MKTENLVRLLAGAMTLLSAALIYFVSPWWLLLTCFVGANLFQSALTGFCPPTLILRKLGWVDADNVIHWGGMKK